MTFTKIATSLLLLLTLMVFGGQAAFSQAGQVEVNRIGQMPNEPSPYNVRDWKQVAQQYDALVYDLQLSGQYLPLVFVNNNGINYPQHQSFGLHSYVGTNNPTAGEGINVLPSLVSATLAGIDKSNQNGRNWVLMSQDYFNKANGEMIYLNNRSGGSGGDWWYDLMPNIYFYQLYDLYPPFGEAEFQFNSVADQFAAAVRAMGGSDTPWSPAYMNYRAWDFVDMQPNDQGVPEPEAAGAYAWVLYHAYKKTGNREYLKAAEWSIEYLNQLATNPSYELQLPYGAYVAAKMNAELGTNYDLEKMVNWSFDRGPLRGWGTIVGNWGGFDVSGLVGEANDNGNDYAFLMNGLQQAGALAPMVRYDKRFARAIAKWILNLANASRLLYPGFLPGAYQDSYVWANTYDPQRVISHEALRETYNGLSPFSTGDAINGGWAATNLALYGSSSVGYLGAIIEKTNVDKILKIDLRKTDFFSNDTYPAYLFFNPFNLEKTVALEVGDTPVDIYDALSESFIQTNVSQTVNLTIPPDEALLLVLTPAGGSITYVHNKMLVNGEVVDYRQSAVPYNYPPRIQALATAAAEVEIGMTVPVYGTAFDPDDSGLAYTWTVSGGTIDGTGATVNWQAPDTEGAYEIILTVTDAALNSDSDTLQLQVVPEINVAPQIISLVKDQDYVAPGTILGLSCEAFDGNGDALTYTWTADAGGITGQGSEVEWASPLTEGIYTISVTVEDEYGASAQRSTNILVKVFSAGSGDLIAYYPFTGNANDVSGNNLHGAVSGALPTEDVNGDASRAYFFDGLNDNILVPNDNLLNFTGAITVTCWAKAAQLNDNELFILSHGSWQSRWKISVIPEHKVRWTVNSSAGPIGDLDSEMELEVDSFYHIGATYDGELMALYINGKLHSYRPMSGPIRTTDYALLMGQMLPGITTYNFRGVLDEVKIYDYALTPEQLKIVYEEGLTTGLRRLDRATEAMAVSPNPAHDQLTVFIPNLDGQKVQFFLYDPLGRLIRQEQRDLLPHRNGVTTYLDISDLSPGLCFLVMRLEDRYLATEFVKY